MKKFLSALCLKFSGVIASFALLVVTSTANATCN
jgi:hypothetical protein